jgi:hypothetical protein
MVLASTLPYGVLLASLQASWEVMGNTNERGRNAMPFKEKAPTNSCPSIDRDLLITLSYDPRKTTSLQMPLGLRKGWALLKEKIWFRCATNECCRSVGLCTN